VNALLELPLARLRRTPRAWLPVALWSLLAIAASSILRHAHVPSNASEALQAPFGTIALPLLSYAVVGATLGGDGLSRSTRSLVAFGAEPFRAALASIGVAALVAATLSSIVGLLVATLGHGDGDPPLVRDAFTTIWVAFLGGAAYAAAFALGASFGKRGGGRAVVLVLDWVFGSAGDTSGVITPRAHLRSLLGGDEVASLSGHASAVCLVLLAAAFAWLAARRARRV
jgi:hypothetical protein